MYYNDKELEQKIRSMLKKEKVKFRSLSISDDKVCIGIEGSKSDYPTIKRRLSSLGLYLINRVYGRWAFRRTK